MCVKYRRDVVDDVISNRLRDIFLYIAPKYNISLDEWNHDCDHVHIIFRGQPNTEISKFINAYKSAMVVQQKGDTYYVSILYEYSDEKTDKEKSKIYQAIGLDYKSDGLYMDSNGNIGSNHKYYKESYNKLTKEQRRLSERMYNKKRYGWNNRNLTLVDIM